MRTVTLRIPTALAARVSATARAKKITKSALIREALEAFLEGNGAPQPGSALELVADLVGCFEGPGDLSFNRKHMEGFGR